MAPSRESALAAGLSDLGCQALLVFAPSAADPDLAPFAGSVHLGESLLIAPVGESPRLVYLTPMERDEAAATGLDLITPEDLDILRWMREAPEPVDFLAGVTARALELAGLAPGRVALAGHGRAGVLHAVLSRLGKDGWTWVPGNDLVTAVRKRKTPAELAAIRAAAEGTAAAFRAVARMLANAVPGQDGKLRLLGQPLTVAALRGSLVEVLAGSGLEQPRGNILAPGEEGGVPHSTGTPDRVLRAGESLVVDLFPRGAMFADCTRTFCVGPPPENLADAHSAVLAALRLAHERAVPGARGWDLQEAVCQSLAADGYPTPISHPGTNRGYVHNLGHGVGFELHEQPIFKKITGAEGLLAVGDVFTLEPGLYDPDAGYGVRLEDLVHLGPDGLENLTPLPYDLDPRAW
jgi:Xaa-Pro aminopeptidase